MFALGAALLLAGCGGAQSDGWGNESAATDGAAAAPAEAPAAKDEGPAVVAAALTAQGFGPLRIGMSRAELVEAMGEDGDPQAVGGPDPESCDEFRPARAPEGLLAMVEDGWLTRISLVEGAKVGTDRGLGIGAAAAEVRSAYGEALRREPHKYEGAPAEYLTFWTKEGPRGDEYVEAPGARGIRYEIGGKGRVRAIHAGGPSIQYVEGCA
jgi:hypothetical protein